MIQGIEFKPWICRLGDVSSHSEHYIATVRYLNECLVFRPPGCAAVETTSLVRHGSRRARRWGCGV